MGPRIPIINTLHLTTYDAETIRAAHWSPRKLAVLQQLDRWTARATKPLFVACSEAVKRSAVRNLGVAEQDVRVIYNSIDQATLRCAPDEPRGISLFLVERMASRWGVDTADGTRVWFELDLVHGAN